MTGDHDHNIHVSCSELLVVRHQNYDLVAKRQAEGREILIIIKPHRRILDTLTHGVIFVRSLRNCKVKRLVVVGDPPSCGSPMPSQLRL